VTDSVPVLHSVLDPDALLRAMAIHYQLGTPHEARLLRSWMNEVYELHTSRGRYALKVYRRGWRSVDQAVYEAELALHLAGHGLAVARPVRRGDGAFVGAIAAPEGERATLLTEWLNGRPPVPPDEAIYERVGRTIAAMHRSLDTFSSVQPRPSFGVATLADAPLRWVEPYLRHRPEDWAFLDALVRRVQLRLDAYQQAGGLDWGLTHGDATLDNLLIADGELLAIYDFDQSGLGWRGYELQGVFHYASLIGRPSFWEALLDGYRSLRRFGDANIAAMPYFVVLNRIWCLGIEANIIATNHGQWLRNNAFFDERLAVLRDWAAAHAELSSD
jgi:Ser/Thr protein kinase RdoA (MazF antagonist)